MNTNYFLEADHGWQTVGEGISRQIAGYNDALMMVKVKFENGAIGYAHQHHHSQTTYVASGKFEVTVGDQKTVLQAGDGFFVYSKDCFGKTIFKLKQFFVRIALQSQSNCECRFCFVPVKL